MTIVTMADVHGQLNIPDADTSHDAELQGYIDAAAAIVGYEVGPITPTQFVETHRPAGSTVMLDQSPIISVVSVVEYWGRLAHSLTLQPPGSTVDNFGFSVDLANAGMLVRRSSAGTEISFLGTPVVVTYVAGYSVVPADVRLAVLEDIRGLYQQTQQGGRPSLTGGGGPAGDAWSSGPTHLFPRLAHILSGPSRTQSVG